MLRGSTTLDTSAVVEYLTGTEMGKVLKNYFDRLKREERVFCSIYVVSEIFYVLCRLRGPDFAKVKVGEMLRSGVFEVCSSTEMALEAGGLKCERAISLADCSCVATAKMTGSRAVFAKRERELAREMERKPFGVETVFLEDLVAKGQTSTS